MADCIRIGHDRGIHDEEIVIEESFWLYSCFWYVGILWSSNGLCFVHSFFESIPTQPYLGRSVVFLHVALIACSYLWSVSGVVPWTRL